MSIKKYKQVDNKVELCIQPQLEPELKKIFEKEMQDGFQGVMEDGRVHYIFNVSEEKASLLRKVSGILRIDGSLQDN